MYFYVHKKMGGNHYSANCKKKSANCKSSNCHICGRSFNLTNYVNYKIIQTIFIRCKVFEFSPQAKHGEKEGSSV